MSRIFYIGIAIAFLLGRPAYALSPLTPLNQRPVHQIVEHFATQYHVSASEMLNTMQCESSLNVGAIGDGGKSFGLSQIYLPAHKNITKEQALDAVFATEYMASEFKKGNKSQWTCARILGID